MTIAENSKGYFDDFETLEIKKVNFVRQMKIFFTCISYENHNSKCLRTFVHILLDLRM